MLRKWRTKEELHQVIEWLIALCGSLLSVEHIEGMVNSNAAVVSGVWSHVAAVFAETETRLNLNGKRVATAAGSLGGGSTKFVIGNAGQDKLLHYYRGQIRSVRISKGERAMRSSHRT